MTKRSSPRGTSNEARIQQEAKALLNSLKAGDEDAVYRVKPYFKDPASVTLQQIQLVIAREHGCDSWNKLKARASNLPEQPTKLNVDLQGTLNRAFEAAKQQRHAHFTVEHALLALLDNAVTADVLSKVGCDVDRLRRELEAYVETHTALTTGTEQEPLPTNGFKRVMQRAVYHVMFSERQVSAINVLVTIFSEKESNAVDLLKQQNITRIGVVDYLKSLG